ncbi:hypothetical protein L1887_61964 [Cichorium endivia]|nr:hypothetical protein L1887_61964 [Cichorium endivia]
MRLVDSEPALTLAFKEVAVATVGVTGRGGSGEDQEGRCASSWQRGSTFQRGDPCAIDGTTAPCQQAGIESVTAARRDEVDAIAAADERGHYSTHRSKVKRQERLRVASRALAAEVIGTPCAPHTWTGKEWTGKEGLSAASRAGGPGFACGALSGAACSSTSGNDEVEDWQLRN